MAKNRKKNIITQGGISPTPNTRRLPDVVLQMPELFMFDMNAYMSSVRSARSIDYSNRVKLYDMYESATLDLHLSGVLDKRVRAIKKIPIEFLRNGEVDDTITGIVKTPWFRKFREEVLMAEFWGFSVFQFYREADGTLQYTSINRKHYNPIRRELLKFQGDQEGESIDNWLGILFVGSERGLGIFSELLPAVLYKRGDMADWAKFCNIFGMPIREYTYDAGDEEARRRLIQDAKMQGSNAVYIHPKDSVLNLVESGNKTGSSDLYKTFADYWDAKISIRVLGNTLTTDAQDTGTQSLGTVHQDEEASMYETDRQMLLDVLNYDLLPILTQLGYNVEGGEFAFKTKDDVQPSQQIDIVQKLHSMGLPMDDDYLYETFAVRKPADYDAIKAAKEAEKAALRAALQGGPEEGGEDNQEEDEPKSPQQADKTTLKQRLRSFFGLAPLSHGASDNW